VDVGLVIVPSEKHHVYYFEKEIRTMKRKYESKSDDKLKRFIDLLMLINTYQPY